MGQLLPFDAHRARTYLHGLHGPAHLYAWRVYQWRLGKGRKPTRPRGLSAGRARMISNAVDVGLGRKGPAVAPAKFIGWQERPGGKPAEPLFNMTAPIPGHPEKSTVAGRTLVRAGYALPPIPAEPNSLIWTGGNGKRKRNAGGVPFDSSKTIIIDGSVYEIVGETEDRLGKLLMVRRPKGTKEYLARRFTGGRGVIIHALPRSRNPMSAAARRRYPGVARLQDRIVRAYARTLKRTGSTAKAQAAAERESRRDLWKDMRVRHNPPRGARASGGARLIYPSGRIRGVWEGRHKNGKLYRHRFGRGLKSIYGLPGGDLLLSAHQGRLWKTFH